MESNDSNRQTSDTLGRSMVFLSCIVALALFTFLAQDWLDDAYNPNRSPVTLEDANGGGQIVLKRNHFGHYVGSGRINGQAATFLLDTGATDVVIPEELEDLRLIRADREQSGQADDTEDPDRNDKVPDISELVCTTGAGPIPL